MLPNRLLVELEVDGDSSGRWVSDHLALCVLVGAGAADDVKPYRRGARTVVAGDQDRARAELGDAVAVDGLDGAGRDAGDVHGSLDEASVVPQLDAKDCLVASTPTSWRHV